MADEEPFDAGDPKSVKKHTKDAKARETKRIEFIKSAMLLEGGRLFFYDLLMKTNCFGQPFVSGKADQTAFNCGEMNVGLQVLSDVNFNCPKEYLLMIEENKDG